MPYAKKKLCLFVKLLFYTIRFPFIISILQKKSWPPMYLKILHSFSAAKKKKLRGLIKERRRKKDLKKKGNLLRPEGPSESMFYSSQKLSIIDDINIKRRIRYTHVLNH